jgi:hypothetical protein
MQDAIFTVLLCHWLGGLRPAGEECPGQLGALMPLEDVGKLFGGEFL